MNASTSAIELVARLANQRIMVVGDLVLDEYLIGSVQRLSREAPVPVLQQTRAYYLPGGAGNPAANIVSLGSAALMIGLTGVDDTASILLELLTDQGVDVAGVIQDETRMTTRKTRIVAEGSYVFAHHLARVDRQTTHPASPETNNLLNHHVEGMMRDCHAVLVSDYQAGVISDGLIATIRSVARQHDILTVVDSQGDLGRFAGFHLIRCNRHEAERFLGRTLLTDADFERALSQMLPDLGADAVVISRGSEGVSVLRPGEPVRHLVASNRAKVFDVTGAGDTLIAVITLAIAAGIELTTAAHMGNIAAGLVVQQLGNVAVTPEQLAAQLAER